MGRVAAELAPPCKGFFSRNSRKILYETRTDGAQEEQRGELQELRGPRGAPDPERADQPRGQHCTSREALSTLLEMPLLLQ